MSKDSSLRPSLNSGSDSTSGLELRIEKMAIGGAGIARHDGLVYFVPFTAPGDKVLVKVTEQKKNFAEAEVLQVLSAGPGRISASCPVAGKCGGCNWQHLSSDTQLEQKKLLLTENLQKFLPEIKIPEIGFSKSPKDFHYRNRIQPKFSNGRIGFYGRRSHDFVETSECLIAEKALSDYLPELKSKVLKLKDPATRFELFLDESGQPNFSSEENDSEGFAFSQVNRFQNEELISDCLRQSEGDFSRIFDLYSGAGNFTFPLARKHSKTKVIAVEMNQKSVARGQDQSRNDKSFKGRVQFYLSSVDIFLRRQLIESNDLVVLDPPRSGCSKEVIQSLAASAPTRIVYISCHPVSLARDVQTLIKQNSSYSIAFVHGYEMFPQTDHFETMLVLQR